MIIAPKIPLFIIQSLQHIFLERVINIYLEKTLQHIRLWMRVRNMVETFIFFRIHTLSYETCNLTIWNIQFKLSYFILSGLSLFLIIVIRLPLVKSLFDFSIRSVLCEVLKEDKWNRTNTNSLEANYSTLKLYLLIYSYTKVFKISA